MSSTRYDPPNAGVSRRQLLGLFGLGLGGLAVGSASVAGAKWSQGNQIPLPGISSANLDMRVASVTRFESAFRSYAEYDPEDYTKNMKLGIVPTNKPMGALQSQVWFFDVTAHNSGDNMQAQLSMESQMEPGSYKDFMSEVYPQALAVSYRLQGVYLLEKVAHTEQLAKELLRKDTMMGSPVTVDTSGDSINSKIVTTITNNNPDDMGAQEPPQVLDIATGDIRYTVGIGLSSIADVRETPINHSMYSRVHPAMTVSSMKFSLKQVR